MQALKRLGFLFDNPSTLVTQESTYGVVSQFCRFGRTNPRQLLQLMRGLLVKANCQNHFLLAS